MEEGEGEKVAEAEQAEEGRVLLRSTLPRAATLPALRS